MLARALLIVRVRIPPPPAEETFTWILQPGSADHACTWYLDGSVYDGTRGITRRAGFGVVVVNGSGQLIGVGNGTPPRWVDDSAGAELWALYQTVVKSPLLPRIVTDCLGVLEALQRGLKDAADARKPHARLWHLVGCCLDGDFSAAAERTVWMPSHTSRWDIGARPKSDATEVSLLDWRANRMADAAAKAAASATRIRKICTELGDIACGYRFHAAMTGIAARAANHHVVDGLTCRDAVAPRLHKVRSDVGTSRARVPPSWRQPLRR